MKNSKNNLLRAGPLVLAAALASCALPENRFPTGSYLPPAGFETPDGAPVLSTRLACGKFILFFYSPGCSACRAVLDSVESYLHENPLVRPAVLIVVRREARSETDELAGRFPVLLLGRRDWLATFGIPGTPTLFYFGPDGRLVRKQLGRRNHVFQIRTLREFFES